MLQYKGLNNLKYLPVGLKLLGVLEKLWICYNNFYEIPKIILEYNLAWPMVKRTIHICNF